MLGVSLHGRAFLVLCASVLASLFLGKRTVKVALAGDGQTPAGVLGEGVEHVVEEADARVDADGLGLACLGGVFGDGRGEPLVGVWGECPAVEVEGHLDLCLVGVAREGGPSGRVRCCRHGWCVNRSYMTENRGDMSRIGTKIEGMSQVY